MEKIGKLNEEKAKLEAFGKLGKPEKPPKEKVAGRTTYSEQYKEAAKALESRIKEEKKAREDLSKAIDDIVFRSRDAFKYKSGLGSEIDITKLIPSEKGDKASKRYKTALELPDIKEVSQDMKAWLNSYEAEADNLRAGLEATHKKMQESAKEIGGFLGGAFSSFGEALATKGRNPFKAFGQFLVNSLSDVLMQVGTQMLISAAAFYAGVPLTAGLTAPQAARFAIGGALMTTAGGAMRAVKFADGGIVSGRTFAEVGEYRGARNNPEVIAPLNKLGTIFTPFFQRAVSMGRVNQPKLAMQPVTTTTNVYMDGKVLLQQLDRTILRQGRI